MASRGRSQVLRIIAGQWRGRKLHFPAVEGLRPTPDRVRETIFNWLMHDVTGARCLDLCCGSGAMGLEALSREAASVLFVDRHEKAITALRRTLGELHADNTEVMRRDILPFLAEPPERPFDLVFFDPPYASGLLQPGCQALEANRWLAAHAKIYLEAPAGQNLPLPENWRVLRSKSAGQVGYHLVQRGT
jgi:16S rRNA (guanine966-N2)-methyltransferase